MGLVSPERWRALLDHARREGRFLGGDPAAYPRDFATYVRYYTELKALTEVRYPLPEPLPLSAFEAFLRERDGAYEVALEDA